MTNDEHLNSMTASFRLGSDLELATWNLNVWTFGLVKAAKTFKRLNTARRNALVAASQRKGGNLATGSVSQFAVTTATLDLVMHVRKAAHYANIILGPVVD